MPFLFRQNMRGCAGPGGHGPGPGPGWLPAGILFLVILLAAGDAGAVGRIDRQGVYVLGGWFQYGVIQGESRYGLDFSNGPGYSVHFRYNMSRKTALAIYFDNQSFSAQTGATALYADSSRAALDQLKLTTAHAGIRFFSVPPGGDVLRYAEITAGFYRPEIQFPKTQQTSIGQDVGFPGEGFLVHVGLGAEIFVTPSWAIELGGHGYALTGRGLLRDELFQGEKNLAFSGQLALGVDYYMLR